MAGNRGTGGEELAKLAETYPRAPWEDVLAALPRHTYRSITARAARMGINRRKHGPLPARLKEGREAQAASLDARHPEVGTARAEAAARRRAPDYGPYDPSSRCGECAHYRLARRDGGCYAGMCGCWKVRGKDGGYLHVRSSKPSCRHFVQGGIGDLGCQPAGARKR